MDTNTHVALYTDGACIKNPGPGGYGAILIAGDRRKELSAGYRLTTNNRMEIMAVIAGLQSLHYPCTVTVYSDSQYVVDAMTQGWAKRWQANGWKRSAKERAVNADLWQRLLHLCEQHTVTFEWVRGHAGHPENERCDRLSVAAAKGKSLLEDEGYVRAADEPPISSVQDQASLPFTAAAMASSTSLGAVSPPSAVGRADAGPASLRSEPDQLEVTASAPVAEQLRHVLWIGGSPCSGKSTVAHALARVYVFLGYFQDPMARNHFARRIAAGDEEAQAFLRKTMDERWLQPSVDEMVATTIASWTRDFQLVLEDLLAMPTEQFIFAEGNYFPTCVAPYLSDSHQAIWLVPTADFCATARRQKHAALAERQKRHGVYDEGTDPAARLRRLIERDIQLARYVKGQAEALGLHVYEVDGTQTPEDVMALVERHFDPYLIAALRQVTGR